MASGSNNCQWGRPITKSNGMPPQKRALRFCGFCRRNGETPQVFESHITKDADGRVLCPNLQRHVCELCGATGEEAHTRSYCPFAEMGRTDPFFRSIFKPSSGTQTFRNMVCLKKTRVNSAGKVRRHY